MTTATLESPKTQSPQRLDVPRSFRWTKEQYHRMGDAGLFEGMNVELIEGEIIEMPSMNFPHWKSVVKVRDALIKVFGADYIVIDQLPISIIDESEPEPDIAVICADLESLQDLPSTACLVVEISDATLSYDKGRKLKLYARAGIAEYWILDVKARRLIVHRAPNAEEEQFDNVQTLKETDVVSTLEVPDALIKIAELLP